MARIKVDLPDYFQFTTLIPVRITDINYGGHVGNDTILSLIHEARVRFLQSLGYKELELEGAGLIMADAAIEFKNEIFYGETIIISIAVNGITKISFDIFYKLEKEIEGRMIPVAAAKTGMIYFDYGKKKVIALPDAAKNKLLSSAAMR